VERHLSGAAVLDLETGETFDGFEMIDERGDSRFAAGDRAVNALMRQKQRAFDTASAAEGGERRTQHLEVIEPGKSVERGDAERLIGQCHRRSH
jgi:hypothetical protein